MDEETQGELTGFIETLMRGRRSGYRVCWTPTEFSMEINFVSLDEQRPTEACRVSAALALRWLMEEAKQGLINGFTAFWDGKEVVDITKTFILPEPLKYIHITVNVA